MAPKRSAYPLSHAECLALAQALGDAPETVIATHQLRRGICRAWAIGDPAAPFAAIMQSDDLPAEPTGYGNDAVLLWQILRDISDWKCVNVSATCAPDLATIMAAALGRLIRRYGDVYFMLTRPAPEIAHPLVRRLSIADLALVQSAPKVVQGAGFGSVEALLTEGVVAGGISNGALIGIAHTSAFSARYADIGVGTLESWRGQGIARAAAALVATEVQRMGKIPVWSTGEDNHASRRIAEYLGFTEIGQRVYLIP